MKKLTLQIDKEYFQKILNGQHKTEHRNIYPSNVSKYVYFELNGKAYKKQSEVPFVEGEENPSFQILPIKYDALYLINGRRKDAPRLLVEVVSAEFVVLTDENGKDIYYEQNGEEYLACQVWYHLGKVIETENVHK